MIFRYRLFDLWEVIRTSYWFVPALLAGAAMGLAAGMLALDQHAVDGRYGAWLGVLTNAGPEGARQVLSAVAASMITVAGTVFSITIVALALAAQQYGPRLLRNFMGDKVNQFVLGAFTATFVYCVLVLRSVHGGPGEVFVPRAAIAVGVVLAIVDVGVLIYFIHHVSMRIQAPHVIAAVWRDLCETADRVFPEHIGRGPPAHRGEGDLPADFEARSRGLAPAATGYIRRIDHRSLMALAERHDLIVRILRRPGDFVDDAPMALVWPAERVTARLESRLRCLFVVGPERTPTQDIEFAFDQLVEVASRALSSGLNDPFTAQMCLDRISAGLARVASRPQPSPFRYDASGRLRVVAEPVRFVDLVRRTFEPIRQYGAGHALVAARLLDTLALLAPHATDAATRRALLDEAERIRASARSQRPDDPQQEHLDRKFRAAAEALRNHRAPRRISPVDGEEPADAATAELG